MVRPKGSAECSLLLAKAVGEEQQRSIGWQTGGRVFLFLKTDDFWRDYRAMQNKSIIFVREPRAEPYGTVAVFKDPFGNLWDLLG
ncbi:VOC family protein [Mucilaginibacter sp. cycad4]|uniref:VOC family protein n=1 Tax=Mucilaginibacter sp. cycad4 TaxID=3342096 RepID=UPI002AAB91D9|nr:VOC family protein [Mucilaginibacter gossypii]WPU98738.1 VOC family protein [Mucilaginibacter gossypii]